MSQQQDYYRILGVSRDAPAREIKRAYYELARKLHPDKAANQQEGEENASTLAAISQAYNTLKDQKKREEYDTQIRGKSAAGPAVTATSPTSAPQAPAPVAAVPPPPSPGSSPAVSKMSQGDIIAQRKAMAQKAFVKGMQLFKRQDFKAALNFFEAAVQNDAESEPQYHLKYAQCIMKQRGSFTKAVEHADAAVAMDPYNVEYKLVLAEINEMAGARSRAREVYADVLRWDKTNEMAKMRLNLLDAEDKSRKGFLAKLLPSMFNKPKK